ncbi:MAG: protein kinase domain-containing protein [Planctomycetota bacterium]|jgi:serine/threonine protein kinase/WD40 repeat protein
MSDRASTAKEIFFQALDHTQDLQPFLAAACGDDQELRAEVEQLLLAHRQAGDFLGGSSSATETGPASTLTEKPGSRIGPYKLLQQIGEGGFGVVYMAEQTEPVRRKVALKIIKPGMDTKEVVARFEAERQALAIMDHPNIARVLDGGATESGRPYFVMELVKGVPLTKFCDDNKLDTAKRLHLFVAVCRAIQHAHSKGVIHRDIKPSNVMITLHDGDPVPKVIDFGVAKAITQQLTEKTMFTAYGQMIGTPQYMSPEQAEMSGLDIDTRSDVYSLGILLFEMLTGTTPLTPESMRGKAYAEMQRMIREDEAPRPSLRLSSLGDASAAIAAQRSSDPGKLRALVRDELDWIVLKSLEKNRERRYETVNSFAADVERFLNHDAVEACPPSLAYSFRKFARRHKAAISVATGFVLLLALSSVIAWYLLVDARVARFQAVQAREEFRDQRDTAIEMRRAAEDEKRRAEQEKNRAESAETDLRKQLYDHSVVLAAQAFREHNYPRARSLLDSCPEELRQWEWKWLARTISERYKARDIPPDKGTLLAVGPHHRVFAARDSHGTLALYDVETGDEIWQSPSELGPVGRATFGPQGKSILCAHGDLGIDARKVMTSSDDERESPLRPGRYNKIATRVLDAETGEERFTVPSALAHPFAGTHCFSADGEFVALAVWDESGMSARVGDIEAGTVSPADILLTTSRALSNPTGETHALAISRDHQHLFCATLSAGSSDLVIRCWSVATGDCIWTSHVAAYRGEAKSTQLRDIDYRRIRIAVGEEDHRLIVAHYTPVYPFLPYFPSVSPLAAQVLDAATGDVVSEIRCPVTNAYWHEVSPNGRLFASKNAGGEIVVWDAETQTMRQKFAGFDSLGRLEFSADGQQLTWSHPVGREGRRTCEIELFAEPDVVELSGHRNEVSSVAFNSTGTKLVSTARNDPVRLWDAATGQEVDSIAVDAPISALFVDEDALAIATRGGVLLRNSSTATDTPLISSSRPRTLGVNTEQGTIIAMLNGYLRSWDIQSGEVLIDQRLPPDVLLLFPNRPRNNQVTSSGDPPRVEQINQRLQNIALTRPCVISRDGRHVVFVGQIGIWHFDLQTGHHDVHHVARMWQAVDPVVHPRGSLIALGTSTHVTLWDATRKEVTGTLEGGTSLLRCLALSPDGKRLFAADDSGTLIVWNLNTKERLLTIDNAHSGAIPTMAVSPSGDSVAIASGNTIRLLDVNPPTDEQSAERSMVAEATKAVDACYARSRLMSDVLEMLRENRSLTPGVRRKALAIAQVRGDLPASAAFALLGKRKREIERMISQGETDAAAELLAQAADEAAVLVDFESITNWQVLAAGLAVGWKNLHGRHIDAVLDAAIETSPGNHALAYVKAIRLELTSRWEEAETEVQRALELADKKSVVWPSYAFRLACLQVHNKHFDDYNETCRTTLTAFEHHVDPYVRERVAKMCLFSQHTAIDVERAAQLVLNMDPLEQPPRLQPWLITTQGIAHYRRGEWDEAIQKLEQLSPSSRLDQQKASASLITATTHADIYLAMACQRAGRHSEAEQWLQKADQAGARLERYRLGPGWTEWLTATVAREEAAEIFQEREITSSLPAYAWAAQKKKPFKQYRAGRDTAEAHPGKASGVIEGLGDAPFGSGSLGQGMGVSKYAGKRVRMSAFAKSEGITGNGGLWMRVDGSLQHYSFDNMETRPIQGTADWQQYEIVLDIPKDALRIRFGSWLRGPGKLWVDDFAFEVVDDDYASTDMNLPLRVLSEAERKQMEESSETLPADPRNLGFEVPVRLFGATLNQDDSLRLVITEVLPETMAAKAGVEAGAVITAVDGQPVTTAREFIAALHVGGPAKALTLLVNGEEKSISLEFPE